MVFLQAQVIKAENMNIKVLQKEILNQLKAEEKAIIKLLEQTTRTWSGNKPTFVGIGAIQGINTVVSVSPRGNPEGIKKWQILDKGSPPHQITARRKPTLAFRQGGFRPKTKVGKLKSGSGRAATGPLRRPFSVRHPGTKARKWTETATKKREKPFQRNMQNANNRGVGKFY